MLYGHTSLRNTLGRQAGSVKHAAQSHSLSGPATVTHQSSDKSCSGYWCRHFGDSSGPKRCSHRLHRQQPATQTRGRVSTSRSRTRQTAPRKLTSTEHHARSLVTTRADPAEPKPSLNRSLQRCRRESIFEMIAKGGTKEVESPGMRMAPSETLRQCIIAMLEQCRGLQ